MEFLIFMFMTLLISSIGFYQYVYFISLGYGFSIAALAITLIVMFDNMNMICLLICICLFIYGMRLGIYLLIREQKNISYKSMIKEEVKDSLSLISKFLIWFSCSFFYVCQISPVYFRLIKFNEIDMISIIGVMIMIIGVVLESLADFQKTKAKKKNENRFVYSGLYKKVRCPNYLGEIIFWSGVFISGMNCYHNFEWMMALFGYLGIIYIMFAGARRLEIRQNKNYGHDVEYKKYVKATPILIPFIPLYSLEKYKWLKG